MGSGGRFEAPCATGSNKPRNEGVVSSMCIEDMISSIEDFLKSYPCAPEHSHLVEVKTEPEDAETDLLDQEHSKQTYEKAPRAL